MRAKQENYGKMNEKELSRFKNNSVLLLNGCREWLSYKSFGYGVFFYRGNYVRAHRLIYTHSVNEVNPDLHVDHLCRNRACVNVHHLEAVTHQTNVLRGVGIAALLAKQTHCKNGHMLSGDNLLKYRNHRICRECKNTSERANYWKRFLALREAEDAQSETRDVAHLCKEVFPAL